MAEKPIKTPLPADLPEDWNVGQTVAPDGTSVGLTEQHGYNYLMAAVNRAQSAVNEISDAFETISTGAARLVVGTSTNGWTAADCDYLCDGVDDQAEIQKAINVFARKGGEVILLPGTYSLSGSVSVQDKVWLHGTTKESVTIKRSTAAGSGPLSGIIFLYLYSKISDFSFESFAGVSSGTYDIICTNSCSVENIDFPKIAKNCIHIESANATAYIRRCTWFSVQLAIYAKIDAGVLVITDNDAGALGALVQTDTVEASRSGVQVFILRNGYMNPADAILDGLSRVGGNLIQGNHFQRIKVLNTSGAKLAGAGNIISGNTFFGSTVSGTPVVTLGENTAGWFVTANALFHVGETGNYTIQDLGTDNVVRFNSDDTGGSTPATVQQATPTVSVSAGGTVTARATQAAGYVAAGTRSATHQLSASDDPDLKPENIKEGVTVFGVTGTLQTGGGTENAVTSDSVRDIQAVTQAEYDALTTKNPTTLYLIKE